MKSMYYMHRLVSHPRTTPPIGTEPKQISTIAEWSMGKDKESFYSILRMTRCKKTGETRKPSRTTRSVVDKIRFHPSDKIRNVVDKIIIRASGKIRFRPSPNG